MLLYIFHLQADPSPYAIIPAGQPSVPPLHLGEPELPHNAQLGFPSPLHAEPSPIGLMPNGQPHRLNPTLPYNAHSSVHATGLQAEPSPYLVMPPGQVVLLPHRLKPALPYNAQLVGNGSKE